MNIDPVFTAWRDSGLVWLPERGLGFYPVTEAPYDDAYFAKYAGYAETEIGRAITKARVALVLRHLDLAAHVVDVGIGCGQFVDAMQPYRRTFGTDINPAGIAWLSRRRLLRDPVSDPPDALTFWDCLEHIHDPTALLASAGRWVFASLPIFTGPEHVLRSRHFRRDEHCFYWTREGLIGWMRAHGFECMEHSTAEALLGREDVHSFAFRRIE